MIIFIEREMYYYYYYWSFTTPKSAYKLVTWNHYWLYQQFKSLNISTRFPSLLGKLWRENCLQDAQNKTASPSQTTAFVVVVITVLLMMMMVSNGHYLIIPLLDTVINVVDDVLDYCYDYFFSITKIVPVYLILSLYVDRSS